MQPLYSFKALGSTLEVFHNRVVIAPRGILGAMKMEGERTIPMKTILAVSFKKAGLSNGHIQFSISGNPDGSTPLGKASSANTVVFSASWFADVNKQAKEIVDYINTRII